MSSWVRKYLLLIILPALLIAAGTEPSKVGTVLKVTGKALLKRGGKTSAIQPRTTLKGGDIIITDKAGEVSIVFVDGFVVNIKPNTEFGVDEPGAEKENVTTAMLYSGVVYARSRPSSKTRKKRSFQIQTPSAVAGVRGTSFGVASAPDGSTRVGVEEGQVEIATIDGETVQLGLREGVEIDNIKNTHRTTEYLPETDNLETWFEKRKKLLIKNPIPAARRLTLSLLVMVKQGEELVKNTSEMTEYIIEHARESEKQRMRGQSVLFRESRKNVNALLPRLRIRLRVLIQLDNDLQARGKLLSWLVKEATAPGSATPKSAIKRLKKHQNTFKELEERAGKIHLERVRLLNERIPELKEVTKYF